MIAIDQTGDATAPTFEARPIGAQAIGRLFVYLCAIVFPIVSTSILVLQPDWSVIFLGVSVATALLAVFAIRVPRELYVRALALYAACLAFLAIKLAHDWAFDLPIRLDKYLSLTARLGIGLIFAAALADKLQLMLRALSWFSVAVVIHALIGQILVIFITPTLAPFLDAAAAESFTYVHIAWLFFYSQTVSLNDSIFIYRAHGIMWEPGIFQFFCNYLIVYGFGKCTGSKRNFLIVLGLTGAILSTSTTGILLAGIIILMHRRFSWRSLLAVAAIMVVPSIFVFANKFSIGSAQSLSTVMRLIDLEVPLDYTMQFPLLGVGNDSSVVQKLGVHSYLIDYLLSAGQQEFLSNYLDAIFETDRVFNTSNGVLALAMQYGVVIAGFYIYGLRNFAQWSGLGRSSFILLLVATLNEPVTFTTLFMWMAMSGLLMPRFTNGSSNMLAGRHRLASSNLTLREST
jgi:hypothetical protein